MAQPTAIGILTSGGDAQGMNAAVRAVVRTALSRGVPVYAFYEGYQGMVEGGTQIRPLSWDSVGGIQQRGGTIIGTARCAEFRERAGRLRAAKNLVERDIDRLVVIGGDGSLSGADLFRHEWPGLLDELVQRGELAREQADRHPQLMIVGLVGSIDNDMVGTDPTIGADSALHRIVEAIDAIESTAASHQRSFVVEVMGRRCGYLAVVSALATGASAVLLPEHPPQHDNWEDELCALLHAGRASGRRQSIVIVAEGATDRHGQPISGAHIRQLLEDRLGEDTRLTVLGHVQRGGAPSAFDRYQGTVLGYAAVEELLAASPASIPQLIGVRGYHVTRAPLVECVAETRQVAADLAERRYPEAMARRGEIFAAAVETYRTIMQARPSGASEGQRTLRLAVLNAGDPAPGMNTAIRVAVRLGLDRGHTILGVRGGFAGLGRGDLLELNWQSVSGWGRRGGAELGTSSSVSAGDELAPLLHQLAHWQLDGLLVVGGRSGYTTAVQLHSHIVASSGRSIPIVCLPASIANDLPGTGTSIGADSALNTIVNILDLVKQTAVATKQCYVVEMAGGNCGYLTLMSGLAAGAEQVYLPEDGITLAGLQADVARLKQGFAGGKRLGLVLRNECADPIYTTGFLHALFEKEGGDLFDVQQVVLGQLAQGGNPSPLDRALATRLAAQGVARLVAEAEGGRQTCLCAGTSGGDVTFHNLADLGAANEPGRWALDDQWWRDLRPILDVMAQPGPPLAERAV
jgi:6-phosphofructokinase 1